MLEEEKSSSQQVAEAKKLLAEQFAKDIADCIKEYNETSKAIFAKYGCMPIIEGKFSGDRIATSLNIVKDPSAI